MTILYDYGTDGITIAQPGQRIGGGLIIAVGVLLAGIAVAAAIDGARLGLAMLSLAMGAAAVVGGTIMMGPTSARFDRTSRTLTIRTDVPFRASARSVAFADIAAVTATRDAESDRLLVALKDGESLTLVEGDTRDGPTIENAAAEISRLLAAAGAAPRAAH